MQCHTYTTRSYTDRQIDIYICVCVTDNLIFFVIKSIQQKKKEMLETFTRHNGTRRKDIECKKDKTVAITATK